MNGSLCLVWKSILDFIAPLHRIEDFKYSFQCLTALHGSDALFSIVVLFIQVMNGQYCCSDLVNTLRVHGR